MIKTSTMHQCSIEPIRFDSVEITCKKDDHGHPCVICKKRRIDSVHTELFSLIKEVPELYEDKRLKLLATLANFLFKGEEFQLITDPKKYKEGYKEQIEREQDSFEPPLNPLISYGVFDVNEISSPKIKIKEGGKGQDFLIFYVVRKIPYKVTCNFPIDTEHPNVKYEMLQDYT